MSEQTVQLQPALILQHRPYRESSVLLEIFTRDFGIVSVLAKGVRKQKSKTAGVLLPFNQLAISYLDRSELKILTHSEFVVSFNLQRLALYCGFYLNELLQKFLHRHDPHVELFQRYQACLLDLSADADIEPTLRRFELELLQETGYGVELELDSLSGKAIVDEQRYRFAAGVGMFADAQGEVDGLTLRLLASRSPLFGYHLAEAKVLLRKMLDVHLQGRPLKSREVLGKIIKYL